MGKKPRDLIAIMDKINEALNAAHALSLVAERGVAGVDPEILADYFALLHGFVLKAKKIAADLSQRTTSHD